jgi:isopentenyl-diphosphate delta-isomerase type 1
MTFSIRDDFFPLVFKFMSEDIFDVVNERDEVIDAKPRSVVHAQGLLHRAVHVLVFNSRGEIFLQKRSMLKDRQPGVWDSSCSGHVDSGETYDETTVRELREEIGLRLTQPPQRLFKIDARKETGWEFCWIYRCESEGPFTLHPDEIEAGDWFAPERVSRWIEEKPEEFASAFVLIWKRYLDTNFTN